MIKTSCLKAGGFYHIWAVWESKARPRRSRGKKVSSGHKGPRKDEWSLWGEEEQSLQVDVLRWRTEHCSLCSDEARGRFPRFRNAVRRTVGRNRKYPSVPIKVRARFNQDTRNPPPIPGGGFFHISSYSTMKVQPPGATSILPAGTVTPFNTGSSSFSPRVRS